jgi:hypothetical protein
MTTEQIKLSDLVEDLNIYPRGSVSEVRVSDLAYALDAGDVPPPVTDHRTRKIVDGFHRVRAHRKRLGPDGAIDADVQEFGSDLEMLLASARLNSPHGLPLGRYDQRIMLIKARQLGADDEQIARALRVTPSRLLQVVIRQASSDEGPVALKHGTEHLGGAYLTADQVTEIRRMRGAPARSKVFELTRLLRQGLVPVSTDPDLRVAMAELADVIEAALQPYTAAD